MGFNGINPQTACLAEYAFLIVEYADKELMTGFELAVKAWTPPRLVIKLF